MLSGAKLGIAQGALGIVKSRSGEPLDTEVWAKIIVDNIITVADTTPQPLKDQCNAFRDGLFKMLVHYIERIKEEQALYLQREFR